MGKPCRGPQGVISGAHFTSSSRLAGWCDALSLITPYDVVRNAGILGGIPRIPLHRDNAAHRSGAPRWFAASRIWCKTWLATYFAAGTTWIANCLSTPHQRENPS
jgi:hypothetical protein